MENEKIEISLIPLVVFKSKNYYSLEELSEGCFLIKDVGEGVANIVIDNCYHYLLLKHDEELARYLKENRGKEIHFRFQELNLKNHIVKLIIFSTEKSRTNLNTIDIEKHIDLQEPKKLVEIDDVSFIFYRFEGMTVFKSSKYPSLEELSERCFLVEKVEEEKTRAWIKIDKIRDILFLKYDKKLIEYLKENVGKEIYFRFDNPELSELEDYIKKFIILSIDKSCLDKINLEDIKKLKNTNQTNIPKTFKTNPQNLEGNWKKGWALDFYYGMELKKIYDDCYIYSNFFRTDLGEAIYQLKYKQNKDFIKPTGNTIIQFIKLKENSREIPPIKDLVIIPVPPSNTEREFQPVYELAGYISEKLGIQCMYDYLKKVKETKQLKHIDDPEDRKEQLKDAFKINDKISDKEKPKKVLLFDDIFRTGDTLKFITDVLKNEGKVEEVYVLTITKTLTTHGLAGRS